jgi:Ca-activated chloride channel family protein
MNTKQRIAALALTTALLAACGGASTPASQSNQQPHVLATSPARREEAQYPAPTMALEATSAPGYTMPPAATAAPAQSNAANGPTQIGAEPASRVPVEPTSVSQHESTATPPADSTFQDYGVNPFIDTLRDHLSTFALDVDTASYAVTQRYLADGYLPPLEAVRAEEFINAFDQGYPKPADVAFGLYADGALSPFHNDGSYLLRLGVQGYDVPSAQRKSSRLTFIIDVSGSMAKDNRLGMVKQALGLLVQQLYADDTVAIAAFTTNAWVALEPTSGADKRTILRAIDTLSPMDNTNVDAGLHVGYALADKMYQQGANNRVVLCSDGVANVSDVDPNTLVDFVRTYAQRDILLTTIGVGMGNYNDVLIEQLADKGNGFYAYVDTPEEAQKLFLEKLTGTLQTIALNAKVQVDFNPDVVSRYRLIGYENRAIADQDFRNDTVDAGEIGAGHTATAIYAVQLRPNAEGRIATLQLRWQDPDTRQVKEISGNVNTYDLASRFEDTSPRYQLAVTVAQFAEILRHSPYAGRIGLTQLRSYANHVARQLGDDADVQEFAQLVARASEFEQ